MISAPFETHLMLRGKFDRVPADIKGYLYVNNATIIDLRDNLLNGSQVKDVVQLIHNNHDTLKELYLCGNDLRDSGLDAIFSTKLRERLPFFPNLRTLGAVDNNTDTSSIFGNIIDQCERLQELYIGARRVYGSSLCHSRYPTPKERAESRGYHNATWPAGYYETGYNEIALWGMNSIKEALDRREKCGNPVIYSYIISKKRDTPRYGQNRYLLGFEHHRDAYIRDDYGLLF